MGKLIYSMLTSLDGYTEDEHGRFRRMYETMVYWETAHTIPD